MPDTTSKTDNFLKAIEKYAEEQRTKMKSEAEVFKAKEMNRAEEEGLKEAYTMIQKKMSEINNQISSELSRAETASKKRIFLKRREIEDEVFAKAEKKLIEYTATDKYVSKLQKSAENISKVLDADDVILYVKEKDMAHKQKLIKAFGRKCEVAVSDDIKLGGITGLSRSLGMIADETLDSRLAEQHEWFCENSGLKVTE
jgi:vacuolar-type H+-ATPase subunit E/Vma4